MRRDLGTGRRNRSVHRVRPDGFFRCALVSVLVMVAGACGAGDGDGDMATETPGETPTEALTLSVDVDGPPSAGGAVEWKVAVTNHTDTDVAVTCPSARTADVSLTRDGRTAYRWSDGRMFAQVVREVAFAPGDTVLVLEDPDLGVPPGTYEAVAVLTCDPELISPPRPIEVTPG